MSNVVPLRTITRLDLDPDQVLNAALGQYPGGVFLAGCDADGNIQFASSIADGGSVLWMMETAKLRMMAFAGEISAGED